MDNYLNILEDLYQTSPEEPLIFPLPYQEDEPFREKFYETLEALKRSKRLNDRLLQLVNVYYLGELLEKKAESFTQSTYYAQKLSMHYRIAAIRMYYIFEPFGVAQIMRTQKTTLTMVRNAEFSKFCELVQKSWSIFSGAESLEGSVVM